MKEAEVYEVIEKGKAKERKLANLVQNADRDSGPPRDEEGKARDNIAEKVNLGSGKTYERAKPAVKRIDELKGEGREKDAEFLKTVLNESVRGAKDLAELESLDEVPEDIKEQVIEEKKWLKKDRLQVQVVLIHSLRTMVRKLRKKKYATS